MVDVEHWSTFPWQNALKRNQGARNFPTGGETEQSGMKQNSERQQWQPWLYHERWSGSFTGIEESAHVWQIK